MVVLFYFVFDPHIFQKEKKNQFLIIDPKLAPEENIPKFNLSEVWMYLTNEIEWNHYAQEMLGFGGGIIV